MLKNKLLSAMGGAPANYIEDVFSTYLYTGNGSTQTITNGIDLAGEGGLIWTKGRSNTGNNWFVDTVRGINYGLYSNSANAQFSDPGTFSGVSSTGYSMNNMYGDLNASGQTYASWTFRKQPKFFDVVTYTGNGAASQLINHNLASVPGMVICKNTTTTAFTNNDWRVWHRGTGTNPVNGLKLNATDAALYPSATNAASFTSTTFDAAQVLDSGANPSNQNGATYVAYLFAHNAGGFGLTGTDNVISCGSFTTSGTGDPNAIINLGYEPQWVMLKKTNSTGNWIMYDTMRGLPVQGATSYALYANLTNAEGGNNAVKVTSVGFNADTGSDAETYIYIAIRRGPMKVPTSGTSVFEPVARTGTGATATVSSPNFPVDLAIIRNRPDIQNNKFADRLRGKTLALVSDSTAAEGIDGSGVLGFDLQNGITVGSDTAYNKSATPMINWFFRRAPGFFDEVCYTGTGAAQSINHNLTVAPELMMVKKRNGISSWIVYSQTLGIGNYLVLNDAGGANASGLWGGVAPTASVFTLGTNGNINASGDTFVWYGFASCPGVSKVGSVTHVEPTTVVCGFTPRFVLIKSTATTGTDDWFVFDSARGITSGNDPYLRLNSTGAENTPFGAADLIDPTADGFIMNGFGGGNYIYLAIA